MAFSVAEIEDGTGKTTAIVWGVADPVAEAVAYLTRRSKTALSLLATDADKEAKLLEAVRFLTDETAATLQGWRSNRDQSLAQPRNGQRVDRRRIPSDELPLIWLESLYLAAELSATGEPLGDVVDADVGKTREALGRNATEDEWGPRGKTKVKKYHAVLDHLAPLLTAPGAMVSW